MEEENKLYTIILRHDTSTNWMASDPILKLGEYGVEDDTHRVKRGNGISKWSELLYESFGLEYIVTFENLKGDITDNEALNEALKSKINSDVFNSINNTIIGTINITEENNIIGKIQKTTLDINNGGLKQNTILIKSSDSTIQGTWSVDEQGFKVLNLQAETAVADYKPGEHYFEDQLCFYNNKLYRANREFTAEKNFNEAQWIIIATKDSRDISYDNKISQLEATTVKEAIDELVIIDKEKLEKTKQKNIVYGTNEFGDQKLHNIDDLRKVDRVNNIEPDENKNVQLDASNINYDDNASKPETIKEKLDQKIDKAILGKEGQLVKNVTLHYDENDGTLILDTTKVSVEDGTPTAEVEIIEIASDAEVQKEVETLNNRIDNEVAEINNIINEKENKVNESINELSDNLNERIDNEVETINETIGNEIENIDSKIDDEVIKLNNNIDSKIDKDIDDSIIVGIEMSTQEGQKLKEPTLKILSKNTSSKSLTVTHLHFVEKGNIELTTENDHIVVDSTEIDNAIKANKIHLDNVDNILSAHTTSITALVEHDVNHEKHLAAHDEQIASIETTLLEHQDIMTELNTNIEDLQIQHELDITKLKQDNATQDVATANLSKIVNSHSQSIDTITDQITDLSQDISFSIAQAETKVDKSFSDNTQNKVVGLLEFTEPENNNLLNINQTILDTNTGLSNSKQFKITSTDNTIIANKIADTDGNLIGIDIATNLDIDVNYFITSETINTEIAQETELNLINLTSTDKEQVEIQDIISDEEGTWGRVKSIDESNNTCIVVTFAKHAQAVWGTIKGNITDQQDLKTLLDNIDEKIDTEVETINAEINRVVEEFNELVSTTKDELTELINTTEETINDSITELTTKVEENQTNIENTLNDTKEELQNNIDDLSNTVEDNKIELSKLIDDAKAELEETINQSIQEAIEEVQTTITNIALVLPYSTNTEYKVNNFVEFTTDNKVVLMAKVLKDYVSSGSDISDYENFIYDVEQDNLALVGIPEQVIPASNDIEPGHGEDIDNPIGPSEEI